MNGRQTVLKTVGPARAGVRFLNAPPEQEIVVTKNTDHKIHTTDAALIRAATTGEGAVAITAEKLVDIMAALSEHDADIKARYPKLVEECPYETRLAVAAWVMEHIVAHAKDGGTFRYLIYDRLGFGPDAYVPLYTAGGMTISNEFNLAEPESETLGSGIFHETHEP